MSTSAQAKARRKKFWKYTKRTMFWTAVVLGIREVYQVFGSRREYRRAVFEEAVRVAKQLNRQLIVLGDPDAGLIHHMLGRDFQCGELCIDPKGCGICPDWIQGRPEDVLASLPKNSAVIYDSGLFAKADDGNVMASMMKHAAGDHVFIADAEPWTLTAFFEPKRKRRVLVPPQINGGQLVFKPLLWHREGTTGRQKVTFQLGKGA